MERLVLTFNPAKFMEMIQETIQLLELPKRGKDQKPPRHACTWSKPLAGIIKVNSDGGLQVKAGIAAQEW
jgi:hypothetical protein